MRILQLCNKPPLPAIDGGCLAMHHLGKGLMEAGIDLTILSVATSKHPFKKEALSKEYLEKTKSQAVFVDTEINVVDAFSSLITKDSYNISRFFSPDFDQKLENILRRKKFDAVILESVFVAPYIPTIKRHCKGKIVLRAHNIEYKIWKRMSKQASNKAKKIYLKHLSKRLKDYELSIWNEVDLIATISGEDKETIEKNADTPILNVPFGIDVDDYPYSWTDSESIFHLGSLEWKPNLEGISWFLDEILPKVKSKKVKFKIAGRQIPTWLEKTKEKKVKVVGEVDSAKDFISKQGIMIVPLLSGGGMRVKIIEGLALGKVVITTSVGAEGIPAEHNKHLIIADSAKDFAQEIDVLIEDKNKRKKLSKKGRELVEKQFSNAKICNELIEFIKNA